MVRSAQQSLAVVVISYNTVDLLDGCLASISPQLGPDDVLVVFDNASSDGSADMVVARHPSASLMRSDSNIGFGRACNEAVSATSTDYVLLLNPDAVAHEGMVDALFEAVARHPAAGIYGGRTVDRDGEVDHRSCWGAPTLWSTFCYSVGLTRMFPRHPFFDPESLGRWDRSTERHVDAVSGALLLIARPLWEQLGGFDRKFFVYGEDLDLCLRARAFGAAPIIAPDAVLTHHVGRSSTRADKVCLLFAGKLTAMQQHMGWRYGPARALLVAGVAARAGASKVLGGRVGAQWSDVWRRRHEWRQGFDPALACERSRR